ncbi:MAG: glycosyltransferase family 4 protein [Coriobacteriia bacterium]
MDEGSRLGRVLVIASFPDSLVRFRGALIKSLLDSGHAVHVAAPDLPPDSPVRRSLESAGVVVHEVSMRRGGTNVLEDAATLLELRTLCRHLAPTHVLAYTVKPVVYGLWAARMTGVPNRFALITGVGYAVAESPRGLRKLLTALVQRLYANALLGCQRVFFQNPDDQATFRQLRMVPSNTPSSVVNGSGVDVGEFAVAPLPDGVRFLLIARLLGEKGVREYAEAAERTRQVHPGASFGLVGWIDQTPDAISESELSGWVESGALDYLGRLDDVRSAIAASSVYVLPSYHEGTPRTVLEAMAMGRPIVTTDAPGCRETVVDGENGFLVPVKSVDALVDAIGRFIREPELITAMGARSREIAEERYDVHKVNAFMLREMGL